MKNIENTITSIDAAQMIGKDHSKLLRDIRIYIGQLGEAKIGFTNFFTESTYCTEQNKIMPCYKITKKGCEFIAHKLTGTKGTIFTARYINRFHEMESILTEKQTERPWFIRNLKGTDIVLERDFITITGIDIRMHKLFYRQEYFKGGWDWNGFGWKCDNEEFRAKHGFDYGADDCMIYFYLRGIPKAIKVLENDRKVRMNPGAKEVLLRGVKSVEKTKELPDKTIAVSGQKKAIKEKTAPIQICITVNENGVQVS